MRAHHFMESDYNEDLRSEIITLLTAVSAEGVDEIDTQNLLNDLEAQGYAIDQQSLMDMLGELDVVSMATGDKITIATSDADVMVGQDAKDVEQDQVDNMATKQATKDMGEGLDEDAERLNVGDPVIITGDVNHNGETGEISSFGQDKMFVVVDLYNFGKAVFQSSDVEFNDYADSEEEEHDMRRAMGDDDYDRMHGDLGYNDDDGDSYYESVNRMRKLAGLCEQEKPYDPAEQFKDIGDAELMAMKNYGLGKQREHARAEIERRKNQPWRWDTGKRK
jgi:hypothetical protein